MDNIPKENKKMRPSNRLLIRLALLSAALLFTWSDRSNSQRETARSSGVDVLTQHNDNDRTGHNPNETILTPDKGKVSASSSTWRWTA
jgi:type II secretory pathway pseudopilin PulG